MRVTHLTQLKKHYFFIIMQKQLYNPSNLNFSSKTGTSKMQIVICDGDHRETIEYTL